MNGFSGGVFKVGQGDARLQVAGREPRYFGRDWPAFWRRLQTRRALLHLNPGQLADIGLSRAEAEHEARRPFWTL
ncbi:DUF1127 domain-containing protein [Pseudomonas sp. EA_105y_Pfl2_R69]|jgi:uncharacterized protein YjiS (DUF1127 family)|uniref:DUF1127 domain-containing protein n=1 Tax=Pseudomonas sp. EA_105y_Pfl2_R69 TaxID=3088683 RepID=UPI0030D9D9CB